MKLNKIASICKSEKQIIIMNDNRNNAQYISDGRAVYPLTNMPYIEEDTIFTVLNINDTLKNKMVCQEIELTIDDAAVLYQDLCQGEQIVDTEAFKLSITIDGNDIIPLKYAEGILFIQAKYLEPIADISKEYMSFYVRSSPSGQQTIAVKNGMVLIALISPFNVSTDSKLIKQLESIIVCHRRADMEKYDD